MPIPIINVKWPRAALKLFWRQAANLASFQSRQQEILVSCPTAAEINTWNGVNPLDYCEFSVSESGTILPSGSIVFWMLQVGDYVPPPNDDGRCNLIAQVGWTAAQCAAGFITQINAYALSNPPGTLGYYATMKALPGPTTSQFRLLMPQGITGSPTALTHTAGPESLDAVLTFQGRVRAFAYGIIGPRRHVFAVPYPVPPERPG